MLCSLLLFSHCRVWRFYNRKDCSPPGSSIHGILQARVLEWAALPSSRASSVSRDRIWVSCPGKVGSLPPDHKGSLVGNLRDINSLTRDETGAPYSEVWSANHCTTREFPYFHHTFTTLCKWEWTGLIECVCVCVYVYIILFNCIYIYNCIYICVYIYVYIILFNCMARASWIWVKWMEEPMLPTE